MTPQDGKDGASGKSPVMVFRGVYSSSKTYYGNEHRLDCVKHGNTYYIARIDAGTFSTPAPPDSSKWNSFGASFESIATNLLLAEGANIGDWFISGGKIVSTLTGENKITLDAKNSRIQVVSATSGGIYSQENLGSIVDIDANAGIVEAQVEELSPVWKPVDLIDEAEMESGDDGFVVIPKPYDAGDHIAYRYERRRDVQSVKDEIQALKDSLSESDYKITKCYEASLLGTELPYDIEELHAQRQAERDKINELEAFL